MFSASNPARLAPANAPAKHIIIHSGSNARSIRAQVRCSWLRTRMGWRVLFAHNACGFCPRAFGCICLHYTAFGSFRVHFMTLHSALFSFVMHLMHISCDAFTEICAFTVHVMECIHSTFNVLHCCALSCICDSLHFWLLHSVAFACILAYLHSRRVAFMCILPPPFILIHSERVALLQLCIHRTCTRIQ